MQSIIELHNRTSTTIPTSSITQHHRTETLQLITRVELIPINNYCVITRISINNYCVIPSGRSSEHVLSAHVDRQDGGGQQETGAHAFAAG